MKKALLLLGILCCIILTACHNQSTSSQNMASQNTPPHKMNIVVTTTLLADLVQNVGGDYVEVTTLIPNNYNPHTYTLTDKDIQKIKQADLFIYHSPFFESRMADQISQLKLKNSYEAASALEDSQLILDTQHHIDPHVWFDINLWKTVVNETTIAIERTDSLNKAEIDKNLDTYLQKLDNLENYIEEKINMVPQNQRVLTTTYQDFAYFAKAYQFRILSVYDSDTLTPIQKESDIAKIIADQRIKSIFPQSTTDNQAIQSIKVAAEALGFNTQVAKPLYSDELFVDQEGKMSFINTMKYNIDVIVDALK